jgi:2-iminobutanoate/2-iminopropanoate deaminase
MQEKIFTENAPAPIGPYSQAIRIGDTLYCSGKIAMDNLEDGIAKQTQSVCENIQNILMSAGLEMGNVVKATCFLVDMGHFAQFNEVYARYFTHAPARSCVAVKSLPKDALVEIEVIAICK